MFRGPFFPGHGVHKWYRLLIYWGNKVMCYLTVILQCFTESEHSDCAISLTGTPLWCVDHLSSVLCRSALTLLQILPSIKNVFA